MSRNLTPVASAMALAIAAAVGPCDASPVPRKGIPGRSMTWTSTSSGTAEKAQDRIATPISARDPRAVKCDALVQRPACRLQDTALDLVLDAVGVDRFAAVDRRDRAPEAYAAALEIQVNFDRERHIGGEVFVTGKSEAPTPALLPLVLGPAEAVGRRADDLASARIVEMAQTKLNRIGLRGLRQLVDKALDREDVHIRAEAAQCRDADRHHRHEFVDHSSIWDCVKRCGISMPTALGQGQRLWHGLCERLRAMPGGHQIAGGAWPRRVHTAPYAVVPRLDSPVRPKRGARRCYHR